MPTKLSASFTCLLYVQLWGMLLSRAAGASVLMSPFQQEPTPEYGEIRGLVLDASDGQPIPGAYVRFTNSNSGTVTNVNGEFRFERIETGDHTLSFSFVGYTPLTRRVTIEKGKVAPITVRLSESTTQLQDVVVIGEIDKRAATPSTSTEISTVNRMRFEESVFTGISREQIVKSLDRNASEVVRRISSVSLLDRFVVVRGLDPRYNLTLLNGIVAPSSEESTRAFSYDALPTGVIDNIGLYKAPAPELPAMWGGGVLDLSTRNTSVAREINVSFSAQYRDNGSSLTDNFLTYDVPGRSGSDDWFSAGADDRRLPAILRQPYFIYPDFETYPLENVAIARAGDFKTYTPRRRRQNLDFRGNFSYYDSWLIGQKVRINNLTAASYTNEAQFREVDRNFLAGFYDVDPTATPNPGEPDGRLVFGSNVYTLDSAEVISGVDSVYEEQIRLSAIQSIGISWAKKHDISATVFYNRFGNDQAIKREEAGGDTDDQTQFSYRYNERSIGMAQLRGSHTLGTHQISWTAGGALTRDDVPDLQLYTFSDPLGTGRRGLFMADAQGIGDAVDIFSNAHYVFETEELSFTGRLDYVKEFEQLYPGLKLKAGAFFDRKDREFFAQNHRIVRASGTTGSIYPAGDQPAWEVADSILAPQQFGPDGLALIPSASQGTYAFDDETRAGYLGVNVPFLNRRANVYAGARLTRFERTLYDGLQRPINNETAIVGTDTVQVPDPVSTYLLPSVSLRYTFPDSLSIIRFAYGQTVDRPQFREQSELSYIDFEQSRNRRGNPGLQNAELHHLDLRYELYPSAGEVATLGAFYKRINNPILLTEPADGGQRGIIPIEPTNGSTADIFGIEAELRKRLDFIALPVISKLSVIANATYLYSEAVIPEELFITGADTTVLARQEVRLQGASPWLANFGLYYDDVEQGTNISVIYNYTGDRLQIYNRAAAGGGPGNLLEARRHELDITFTQQITDFLQIKGGVQNVLNNTVRFYRDGDGNYEFNPGQESATVLDADFTPGAVADELRTDFSERAFKPGRYYSLGVSLTFR